MKYATPPHEKEKLVQKAQVFISVSSLTSLHYEFFNFDQIFIQNPKMSEMRSFEKLIKKRIFGLFYGQFSKY